MALATGDGNFERPTLRSPAFGASAAGGGWSSQDLYPRELADVNGDGMADIVGFGNAGVFVALATGGGNFARGRPLARRPSAPAPRRRLDQRRPLPARSSPT